MAPGGAADVPVSDFVRRRRAERQERAERVAAQVELEERVRGPSAAATEARCASAAAAHSRSPAFPTQPSPGQRAAAQRATADLQRAAANMPRAKSLDTKLKTARTLKDRLQRITSLIAWRLLPLLATGFVLMWFMREVEDRTFYMPGSGSEAVRKVLIDNDWTEVPLIDKATLIWVDERSARLMRTRTASSVQRVNTLDGVLASRGDAVCRALDETRRALLAKQEAAVAAAATAAATAAAAAASAAAASRAATSDSDAEGDDEPADAYADANADANADAEAFRREARALSVSIAECYVLPEQRDALTERITTPSGAGAVAEGGGGGFGQFWPFGGGNREKVAPPTSTHWMLQPADPVARREAGVAPLAPSATAGGGGGGGTAAVPLLTNNPEALPSASSTKGVWTAVRHEARPFLLDGRRIEVELFALISSAEPLRMYLHTEGVLHVAERPNDAQLLKPDDPGPHVAAPPAEFAPAAVRHAALQRMRPLSDLWLAIDNSTTATLLWSDLERAAAAASLTALAHVARRGGGGGIGGGGASGPAGDGRAADPRSGRVRSAAHARATSPTRLSIGASREFSLQSVRLSLDEALTPTVVAVDAHAALPLSDKAPAWHRETMKLVASHALNLTGAALHPQRRPAFWEVRRQLQHVLAQRQKAKKRMEAKRAGKKHAGASTGKMNAKPDRRNKRAHGGRRDSGGGGGGGSRPPPPPPVECEMVMRVRGRGHRRNAPRAVEASAAAAAAEPKADADAAEAGPTSRRSRRRSKAEAASAAAAAAAAAAFAAEQDANERCVSRSDVDLLAETDIEWFWRLGFRRVLPGANADPVRAALRPMSAADELLADYLNRWPKDEEPLRPLGPSD